MSALAAVVGTLLVLAMPALAADRSTQSLMAERIAFGTTVAGGVIFFVWVAWLTFRR